MQSGAGLDAPITYVANGVLPAGPPATLAVVGDFGLAVLGVRQDMTYELLDQAVITDDTGKVIFNLAQQDMLALRVVFRAAFATAAPVTRPVSGLGDAVPVRRLAGAGCCRQEGEGVAFTSLIWRTGAPW